MEIRGQNLAYTVLIRLPKGHTLNKWCNTFNLKINLSIHTYKVVQQNKLWAWYWMKTSAMVLVRTILSLVPGRSASFFTLSSSLLLSESPTTKNWKLWVITAKPALPSRVWKNLHSITRCSRTSYSKIKVKFGLLVSTNYDQTIARQITIASQKEHSSDLITREAWCATFRWSSSSAG